MFHERANIPAPFSICEANTCIIGPGGFNFSVREVEIGIENGRLSLVQGAWNCQASLSSSALRSLQTSRASLDQCEDKIPHMSSI